VDATYRSELRDLIELNYARFEAKLEQRIAEVRADLVVLESRLGSELDTKLAALEGRMEVKLAALEGRMDARSWRRSRGA
jgi:hypothetical protein